MDDKTKRNCFNLLEETYTINKQEDKVSNGIHSINPRFPKLSPKDQLSQLPLISQRMMKHMIIMLIKNFLANRQRVREEQLLILQNLLEENLKKLMMN